MKRRQHGEGSLFQRSRDNRWVAVADLGWTADGKRDRRYFVAESPDVAIERRARFLDKRREGFTLPRGRPPTVSEWMDHWLRNVARPRVEQTTYDKSYKQKVEELIVPYFTKIRLPDLTEEDIESWHRHLQRKVSARTGRPLSAGTITTAHRILGAGLKVAVIRGRMPRNPVSNVPAPKARALRPQLPDVAQLARIRDACKTRPNGARWIVAIATGIRQGEALALEWRNVRLTAPATLTVERSAAQVKGGRITKAPKSEKSLRTISLPRAAADALKAHRETQTVRDLRNDLVFATAEGKPLQPKADWLDWRNLLDDLQIPYCRPHDLRKLAATLLMEGGENVRVVQEIMGHASAETTMRIYQEVRKPALEAAAGTMDRLLGGWDV